LLLLDGEFEGDLFDELPLFPNFYDMMPLCWVLLPPEDYNDVLLNCN
jgi:hypothetical protein